ncbi:hypothetical protein FACS1894137_17020 [Spirochaetia bacterium]|nr:hypothetical protein FACS1894137_17020 [Spirochaetia bacterium]
MDWVQMFRLYKIIVDDSPSQYKFEFALWTVSMVRDLLGKADMV